MCRRHYGVAHRTGEFGGSPCLLGSCNRIAVAKGYCGLHAKRVWAHGDPNVRKTRAMGSGSITKDGYVTVRRVGHPNSNSQGRILLHRLMMSDFLERPLFPDENVHHKDGDRTNNVLCNLELWVVTHPSGTRALDRAKDLLDRYSLEVEKLGRIGSHLDVCLPLGGYQVSDGYWAVKVPRHPNSRKDGYILAHRYVMSVVLGRPLSEDERVHHLDGNKLNNRPDNLELWRLSQPPGQRPIDAISWAHSVLRDDLNSPVSKG